MKEYLATVVDPQHRKTLTQIYEFLCEHYPQLSYALKWNQPMFLHNGTFIIAFSHSSQYVNIAPEPAAIAKFAAEIDALGFRRTKNFWCIGKQQKVNFELLRRVLDFNLEDKAGANKFWR